jgi:hypothetical protein
MLGSDKSRGYCLEMICADFLAGAQLQDANPGSWLSALGRLYFMLPDPQKTEFLLGIERPQRELPRHGSYGSILQPIDEFVRRY